MRAIALRSILYCSKMFNPGEVVEINDPDYLDLLREHGSIGYENGSEEFDISEVATENDAETTETAAEEEAQKPIGRKGKR